MTRDTPTLIRFVSSWFAIAALLLTSAFLIHKAHTLAVETDELRAHGAELQKATVETRKLDAKLRAAIKKTKSSAEEFRAAEARLQAVTDQVKATLAAASDSDVVTVIPGIGSGQVYIKGRDGRPRAEHQRSWSQQ